MKINKSKLTHNINGSLQGIGLDYIKSVLPMLNEQNIIKNLIYELSQLTINTKNLNETNLKLNILYYCCGPAPFLFNMEQDNPKLLNYLTNKTHFIGIDLNQDFIDFNKNNYPQFEWVNADAVKFKKKNSVSILNSSYHHIPDNSKIEFLKNVCNNLEDDGVIIMGENFLPFYKNELERSISVEFYYSELINYLQNNKCTPESIELLKEVLTYRNFWGDRFMSSYL